MVWWFDLYRLDLKPDRLYSGLQFIKLKLPIEMQIKWLRRNEDAILSIVGIYIYHSRPIFLLAICTVVVLQPLPVSNTVYFNIFETKI